FEDMTQTAGLDSSLHGTACATGDYDNDGFADIVVGRKPGLLLLHNEKNGTFKDVTPESGLKAEAAIMGLTFVDYDHDGDIDLYVREGPSRPIGGLIFPPLPAGRQLMWRNNSNGTFTDVTDSMGLGSEHFVPAAVGTDYNNDRAVDIILTGTGPTF